MTGAAPPTGSAPGRRVTLNLGIGLAWIAIYLLLMGHGGWAWDGPGVFGLGMPKSASLERFGAPVPALVEAGEWQRLVLSPWLHRSLLGIVLLLLFWVSLGRTLTQLFGTSRAWLVFLAGGIGGATVHVVAHAGSAQVGGAGPFDPILGALGVLLLWSLTNTGPQASAVFRSTVVSLLLIGVITFFIRRDAPDTPEMRALLGWEAELGAFGAGLLVLLLFGPRRVNAPPGGLVRAWGWLGLVAVVAAFAVQVPEALASAQRAAADRFLQQLGQTEYEAWWISQNPTRATPERRGDLQRRLDALAQHDFLDGYEGADALQAYVATLRVYTTGDVPRPWEAEAACRRAFRAWYERFEEPLREEMGLPARSARRHFWEAP